MLITGRVWKYGHHVNTDVIFPGKYTYTMMSAEELAAHALEDLDPAFAANVRPGDVILGGENWGCGSSREQAVSALAAAGVGAILAVSFARIYYRNAINSGLPAILSPEAYAEISDGMPVRLDLALGELHFPGGLLHFPPFSDQLRALLDAGGLIPSLRRRLDG